MDKELKATLLTIAIALLGIGLYNSFFKTLLPTSVRNFVGLG